MSNTDTTFPENISTDIQVQQQISQLQQQLASLTVDKAAILPELLVEAEAFQNIEQQLDGTFEKRIEFAGIYKELERLAADRNLENSKINCVEEALPSIKKQAANEFFTQAILPSLQELTGLLNEYEPQFAGNEVLEKHLEGIRLIEKSLVQSLTSQGFTPPVVEVVTETTNEAESSETADQVSDATTDVTTPEITTVNADDITVATEATDTLEETTITTVADSANNKE